MAIAKVEVIQKVFRVEVTQPADETVQSLTIPQPHAVKVVFVGTQGPTGAQGSQGLPGPPGSTSGTITWGSVLEKPTVINAISADELINGGYF